MRKTGYTLVEMLAVISVVMLLMAMIFAIMGPVIQLIYRQRCTQNLHEIGLALKQYRAANGAYPNPSQVNVVQALAPYMKGSQIVTCPKAPKAGAGEEEVACSYNAMYNYWGLAIDATTPQPLASKNEARTNYEALDNPTTGKKDFWYTDTLNTARSGPNTDFPGLANANAGPDTIIFFCTYHNGDKGEFLVLRLNGEVEHVKFSKMTTDEQTNFWALSKRYNH
jgi:type II secretory pathway pseudopilin PulG